MGAQFKTGGFAATSYREFDADPVGANERLWVGNMEACEKFEGARICVAETPCRYVDSGCIQIPILTRRGPSLPTMKHSTVSQPRSTNCCGQRTGTS